jgi:hypothetical protein
MKKPVKIVLDVSGGVVQEVYSTDPSVEVILVDWDNIKQGGDGATLMNVLPSKKMYDTTRKEVVGAFGKNWEKNR